MTLPTIIQGGPDGNSVVFYDASWEFYETMLREYDEEPSRMSYDEGTLEISMTLSMEHEAYKSFIGDMVSEIAKAFRLPMARRGSATLKLHRKQKGLEADQCYWVANEQAVRSVRRLDLTIHPPPDLVVEIDVAHAVVDREAIYAVMGVPEMWHFDASTKLTGWELSGGVWQRLETSRNFPAIRVTDLNAFLDRYGAGEEETSVLLDFRQWLTSLTG